MKNFIKNHFGGGWEAVFYLTVFFGTPIGLTLTAVSLYTSWHM